MDLEVEDLVVNGKLLNKIDMKESKSSSGIGFASLLGLLFIGLKLGKVITWSWWWVLLPFYIGPVIFLVTIFSYFLYQVAKDWGKPKITTESKLAMHIFRLKQALKNY